MHRITHCPSRDHPREYGENRVYISDSARNTGSSPRIRGESTEQNLKMGQSGIIPANTGRIAMQAAPPCPAQDHPREYGENGWKT